MKRHTTPRQWKKSALLLFTSTLFAILPAKGAILTVDNIDLTVFDGNDQVLFFDPANQRVDFDGWAWGAFEFHFDVFWGTPGLGYFGGTVYRPDGPDIFTEYAFSSGDYVMKLQQGDIAGPSTGSFGMDGLLADEFWAIGTSGYLVFRIESAEGVPGSDYNYGWLHLTYGYEEGRHYVTFHSMGYNTTVNEPLTVIPEPSSIVFLALGGIGVAAVAARARSLHTLGTH